MPTKKEIKETRGRPSSLKDPELIQRNIEIYTRYFVDKFSIWDLEKYYGLKRRQVYEVLKTVGEKMGNVPERVKLEGHIHDIRKRTKDLIDLQTKEKKRKVVSIRNVNELEVQVRNNGEVEMKLEGLLKNIVKIEGDGDGSSILAILKVLSSEKEK